ncbi:triphosphoribosyl-dephospho-CoA synthase [Klebsiella pneumoniae subsp. pneumoniae]|nr:triphosphoribosyl-dephospho-CoA synthase [Klebsiella pneumoniae subsp. pneumoniae]
MAWNDDTNLVSRGGLAGLNFVQQEAQRFAVAGRRAGGRRRAGGAATV